MESKRFRCLYELDKYTPGSARFKQRLVKGQTMRVAELGYVYMKKELHKELGSPFVVQIDVTAYTPELEDV